MTLVPGTAGDASLRAGPLVMLPELLRNQGYSPEGLLEECGFCSDDFRDPEQRYPFLQTGELLEHCVTVTGIDHLGLLLGQMATPSHLGLAGFVAGCAPTVESALRALVDNLDLHDQGGVVLLETGPRYSNLRYSLVLPDTVAVAQIYDLSAVIMYQLMRKLCGSDWTAHSVNLERRRPADTSPYQKFFNAQLYFNATENALTFPSRWLKHKPQGSDELLYRHLTAEAEQLHERHTQETVQALPTTLRKALMAGKFSSNEVASALGLHERTLHRRLKAADSSFRQELDAARRAIGEELLASTTLPICDIATALGYADSSSFIRAFQRWSNTSPAAWRRQHTSDQHPTG